MKKLGLLLMLSFALAMGNHRIIAQSVTVVLMPGWNWISVPLMDTLDFETAMGSVTPVDGDIIKSHWGSAAYSNGQWRGTISQFYPGYGYHYKSNRTMPVMLTFNAPQPASQVAVTTSEPMLITAISAMCGGEVTVSDGTYIIVKGLCWAMHENPTTNDDFYQEAESGVGSFSLAMTGLNISTTYYVRAYAVTPNGTVYGDQKTFTTRDGIPTLTTTDITNITGASAKSGGNITDNGGLNVTARGVCWNTNHNPTINHSHTSNGAGTGNYTSNITGLDVSTTYYVRAYAITSAGTAYGEEVCFITRDGIPTLTTTDVTNIGSGWATSGGNIFDDGGLGITARGVCWSTTLNPTISDSYTTNGTGTGIFTSYITGLNVNTTYYLRAYATTSTGTYYGEQVSFTTFDTPLQVWVDLGLPSGLLWATCNVGADHPEDYGDYFAWGETQPKTIYNWNNYQYSNGFNKVTKYCTNSSYGFTDYLTILLPENDAATANWDSSWRMPTKGEWQELYQNTTHTWTVLNGVRGRLFTASNGNSLFLPAAGYHEESSLVDADWGGYYWSSSLYTDFPISAWVFEFYSDYYHMDYPNRLCGHSVRPVRCKNRVINVNANPTEGGEVSGGGTYMDQTSCTISAMAHEGYIFYYWTENGDIVSAEATYSFTVNENRNLVANFAFSDDGNHGYVDLALPSGLMWATCNVGANSSIDCGDYFAWGETVSKDVYDWSTYQYCSGDWNNPQLTKYCSNSEYGYNGYIDNLTFLDSMDDAATANWGSGWRMPTTEEWQELYQGTTVTWMTRNGVNGQLFTASNGNSLFLPAAGYRYESTLSNFGSFGYYWSSLLNTSHPGSALNLLFFGSGSYNIGSYSRYCGLSVRPIRFSE